MNVRINSGKTKNPAIAEFFVYRHLGLVFTSSFKGLAHIFSGCNPRKSLFKKWSIFSFWQGDFRTMSDRMIQGMSFDFF